MKQKNLILIFALIISILILICSVCFLLGYLNFFNITGNVVSSNECTTKGYICGNIDGAGPIVSCSKIAKDYVGDVNLDKACGLSGMAGCCKEKVISAKTVASYTLRGKVWDSSGELMPYVGVKVIGTNAGGMTNEEGIFNINVLENKVYNIELSFVGYKKLQAIISPDNKDYIFRLEEDLIMIDEIVVVGELDEPSPQTETNPSGTNPVKDEGTTPSVISEGSISSSSQTYASILKNKAYSSYGNFPWKNDKFKQDTKDICTKCTSASYCETDKSDSLANSDNYFYNNLYVRASCTDSAGVHFDYCADDKNIVEFGCGNEGSCSEIKKECPGACDGKGGVCEKGAVIFLPDLGKHDTKELAIEDANLEIMSAKKLKEIYKKKGYSVEIIALAQSDENILEVYKNNFEKILNVNESINAVKSSFENNNILLVAFFGHGGRNEEFNIQNYELYRKEGKYNLIEVITFLPGKMEIQHATYNEVGYGASLDKLEKIDFSNISKQIEYYNCGLIDNGGIFAPALPWIVSQREIMEYNDLKNELNKFISGEKSKLSPPEGLKIGEKDKCSCRYETSCPITTGFCPEITDDAGAAKVASGTSAGCSITLNKNQIAVGNKIIEILNKPEFQKQILSTSGYSSMQELDNEVLTGSHNNASSFSMLILEIAVKESTLKHCVNANAKNPFYCETNEASVLKNPDGSGWGVMQVNPKAHGEVINFEKNVKTGVLIFAEAFKSKESDKYCTDSTITRTALRKYNSCNAGSKKYPANVFKYKGVIEEYFPELKKSEDPFIQLIEQANANSQQSCPVAKIAKQTSTQNLKLTIDVYILDDNKKMSDSFNKDPNELLIPILNSVKNYYADIGKDYSLSGVDLTFVIKKGVKTIDRTNLGKDHLALVFTTKQKVEEVFLEDPDRFIYDWLGRRVPTIVQDFEKLAIPGAKKENMELKEFKKKFYWGAFSGPRIGNFGSNNVVASGIGYISYIFPESNNYGESMIINSQSQIIVHEFGHNFGLPHSKEEYLGDKINLMYEFTANPNMPFDNSKFSFSECDVRKILDQLSCSSPSGGAQKVAGGVCTASADVELSCAEDLGGVGKVAANACNVPSFDELKKEEVIKKLVQRYGEERVENVFVTNQKNKLFNKEYILAVADEKTYKFEDIESIVNFIDLSRNYPNTINSEDYRNLYSKILNLDKTKFNINGNPYFLLVSDILVLAQKENLKKSESRSYDAENILKLFWLKSNDHSISQYTGSRLYKTAPYFINLYQNEINQNKYNFWASLVLKKLSSLDILISVDKRFDRDDFLKTINYGSSSDIEDFLKYYSEVSPQVTNEIMLLIPEFSNIYNNEKLINENTNTKTSISLAVYRFRTENPSWSIEKSIDYILQKRKEFGNKEIIGSNTYFISFVHQEEMFSNNPLKVYAIDRGAFVDSSGGEDGLKGPKEKELIKNTIINSKDKGETTIWINVHGAPTRLALDQTTYFSPGEIGDILLKRGNLQEVILILDACHSYNFAENLINYLEIKGSKSYPTIITETNKNRFGRFNVLLKSFISLNKKLDEPLLGKDVLNAGSFSFDIQDSAFFFSQTGKDKPIEISQNYMNHECTGEDCVNGVCTASAYVNNLEEDSCLDNPDFSKGVAKVASDEKMCKDPVLYRMDYFVPIFHKRLENDKTEIKKWSEFTGVPQEAILSGILVEDIRMDNEGIEEKVHNLKSYVRSLVPNKILETFGHNPNPEDQKSVYGFIHCDTFRASLLYLISLKDLNQELKKSLLEIENNHNQYVKENGGYGVECMSENYNQKVISSVGRVAITQKAQIEYWKRAGYDIFNYKFKTINTLGERAGVLITLTSIYSPEYEYPKGITKNSGGGGLLEGAVYKNRFIKCDNKGENCVVETSSDSPRLGGTILWKGRDVSYGELAKIYVDNGYVNSYLQK